MMRLTTKNCDGYRLPLCAQLPALLLVCLTIFSKKGNAQESLVNDVPNKFTLGVTGGGSFNRFSNDQPHTGYNVGVTGGLLANYRVASDFSIQLEANFLQQGGQMLLFKDDTKSGQPESIETKNVTNSSYYLNSLEIPLMVNYTFNIRQSWKPGIYIGGNYAYTFEVTENYQKTGVLLTGEDVIATVTDSRSRTKSFNQSRFGLVAGANLQFPVNDRLKLLLDFRYLHGLTPAREHYSYMDKVGFGSDITAHSFITKIGLLLPLK